MIVPASSIKRQMKNAVGSVNVAANTVEEVDQIIGLTLNYMAKRTVGLLKRKKTASEQILTNVSPENLYQGVSGVIPKAPIVRYYKESMNAYGTERPYRMTKGAEEWLANFVNDLVYTLAYKGVENAYEDGKKTVQPNHIKLAHQGFLVENMY